MVIDPLSVFWFSAFVLGYTYVGYPILIGILARRVRPDPLPVPMAPTVSILVVVRNEADRIQQRIENLLSLDYDREKLEIVIASDASSDQTVANANAYRHAGVHVIAFTDHRGKPAVLNRLVPTLTGEVVVLMDARQEIAAGAVKRMLQKFADPKVGAVSGELELVRGENADDRLDGVGFYWRYEKYIRKNESNFDSVVGVTGALYAFRKSLFDVIPDGTLLDDVLIPMQIVRKGYRVLFEPGAYARDTLSATPEMEFRRKVRTIAGNFQLFISHPWLLNPFANRLWFQTVSHKVLRLLCPVFLVSVLVANWMLLDALFYQVTLALQGLFYVAALAAQIRPELARNNALLSAPHAFCLLNISTVVGFIRFVGGRQQVTWA